MKPLRILFDTDIFISQRRGGVRTYFTSLIIHLGHQQQVLLPMSFVIGDSGLKVRHLVRVPKMAERPLRLLQVSQVLFRPLTFALRRRGRVDIYHATAYTSRLRARHATRRVVTVHDMTPQLFPEYFPNGDPHGQKRENVREADLVLCVSETTKRDLMALYGTPAEKIRVTPLAYSRRFSPRDESAGFDPFILFVGQRDGYKNFEFFVELCELLADTGICGRVVGPQLTADEASLYGERLGKLRIGIISADDDDLAQLYRTAAAFIYPSLYEGFGMPVLEAMASGCPCVLSDTDAFREVAADAAVFVHPTSSSDAARAVQRLAADPVHRHEIVSAGLKRARDFSWTRTAQLTLDAYREVLRHD